MKILTLILLLAPLFLFSQNVGIGTSHPDASAKLDVQSTSGGVLIPRLTTTERDAIPNPASGLLVYNSATAQFEFYNGSSWGPIASAGSGGSEISDADGDTKVTLEHNPDEDIIRFQTNGVEHMQLSANGLYLKHKDNSLFIGDQAGLLDDGNNSNLFIGEDVAASNANGTNNVSIGIGSSNMLNGGNLNTVIGAFAANNLSTGSENVAIGYAAGRFLNSGESNIIMGRNAGLNVKTGSRNIYIGEETGANNNGGSDNVFIGFNAGGIESGSNKLHIGNMYNRSLIYGEFDNEKVRIDGDLETKGKIRIGDDLKLPFEGSIKYDSITKTFFGFDGSDWLPFNNSTVLNDNSGYCFPFENPMSNDYIGHRMAMDGDYIVSGGFTDIAIHKIIDNIPVTEFVMSQVFSAGIGGGHSTFLGMGVDISDDKVIAGAPELLSDWQNGTGLNTGGVCFFELENDQWQFDTCIAASSSGDFGSRVAIDGDFAFATNDELLGVATIFEKVGNSWITRLTYNTIADERILAIDISGTTAALLIQESIGPNAYQNKIRFFKQSGVLWVADGELNIGQPSPQYISHEVSRYDDFYATGSLILSGDELFIANTSATNDVYHSGRLIKSGEVHYYKKNSSLWNLEQIISPDVHGRIGIPIKFSNGRLAIGAKGIQDLPFNNGELKWATIFYVQDPNGLWVEDERHNFANIKTLGNNGAVLELKRPLDLSTPDDNRWFKF